MSTLDLNLLSTRLGGYSEPLAFEHKRDLNRADLELVEQMRGNNGTRAKEILKLRGVHHRVAKLLAAGLKDVEVSAVTGYCQSRISVLKKDPAFKGLMDYYAEKEEARSAEVMDLMKDLSMDALVTLRERLEDEPDTLTVKQLLEISQLTLDRTGHGPVTRNIQGTVKLSPEDVNEIKDITRRANEGRVHSKRPSEDKAVEVGRVIEGAALVCSEKEEGGEN